MRERPKKKLKLDQIGYWSEIKLDIIRDYAKEYSKILAAQQQPRLYHVYIDAFAGAGVHLSKSRDEEIPGSPQIAVATDPPFREYHFIDVEHSRVANLRQLFRDRPTVHIYEGDCNRILLAEIFPKVRYENYRRGLCLLDPYGLHLDWEVIRHGGQMKSLDVFLNFPIMDMNMNVFWRNPEGVDEADIARMNAFWGDDSWRRVAYRLQRTLWEPIEEKNDNETIAEAFRVRLKQVAGFSHVPAPIPMRNTIGATVYYLYFASQKPVAANIVNHIFDKYRNRGAVP
jgi:three-Cys-motif partner protein